MKKILLLGLLLSSSLFALRVDTTYATLGAITEKIGGDKVNVTVLANPKYDPHFIVPKPSLLSKLRRADLLIINGGGLEIGWLPSLIRNANNANIQVGANGFLDISHFISMINVPASVSRAFGDVHAFGNPHYTTDPHRVLVIAKAIADKLIQLDYENASTYETNLKKFTESWNQYLKKLDANMSTCKTEKVIQYHKLYNYFLKRYNIKSISTIQPLPGISPSSKHTLKLISIIKKNDIKVILQDVYHEKKTAAFISDKTGVRVEVLPHDLNSLKNADTLENLYTDMANKICR